MIHVRRLACDDRQRRVVAERRQPRDRAHQRPPDRQEVQQIQSDDDERGREERRAPAARTGGDGEAERREYRRHRGQVHDQAEKHAWRGRVEARGREGAKAEPGAAGHDDHRHAGHQQRRHERPRDQDVPRYGSRQLEIHEAGFDFVCRLGGEIRGGQRDEHDDDRMKVTEGDRPLERHQQHRLRPEAALQEPRHQLSHPAERVLGLDRRGLPDDHELKHEQDEAAAEQDEPRLHQRAPQQRARSHDETSTP